MQSVRAMASPPVPTLLPASSGRQPACRAPAGPTRRSCARRFVASTAPAAGAGGAGSEKQPVREAPKLSALEVVGALVDTNPGKLDKDALGGYPFAWSSGKLYIADMPTIKQWMTQEWQMGTATLWPDTISELLGAEAIAVTRSAERHGALRELFSDMLKDSEMERMLPGIEATVHKYLAQWAARGTVTCYTEMLTLIFDVLVNQVMQLGWGEADIKKYAVVFETWNQGFTAIKNPLPWSKFNKGMRARQELIDRLRVSLRDPALKPGSIPAKLRDTYGADSDVCTDNLIMAMFAGFETTCGLATGLLAYMSQSPSALEKLRKEQGGTAALTPASLASMKYTQAALDEVLRLRQMVAGVPRVAIKDVDLPRAPPVSSGCPLKVSFAALSLMDPAVKGEEAVFRPERWLDAANAATQKDYQKPFGYGQHECLGRRVARAFACTIAREVALNYSLKADANDDFDSFPTGGRPRNGLPLTLTPL